MKRFIITLCLMATFVFFGALSVSAADDVGQKTQEYFDALFSKMKIVAEQHPDAATYR